MKTKNKKDLGKIFNNNEIETIEKFSEMCGLTPKQFMKMVLKFYQNNKKYADDFSIFA